MNYPLTQKQITVLEYIQDFKKTLGYTPSTRDLKEHFGWKSQTSAMNYIRVLVNKGCIAPMEGRARCLIISPYGSEILLGQSATV